MTVDIPRNRSIDVFRGVSIIGMVFFIFIASFAMGIGHYSPWQSKASSGFVISFYFYSIKMS